MKLPLSLSQKRYTLAQLQTAIDALLEEAYTQGRDDCGYGQDAHEMSCKAFSHLQLRRAYVDGWNQELTS